MMDIEKLDINAVCFGILCNFTPVCGEEKAKEAVALIRSLQTENEKMQAEVERQRRSADNGQHLYENAERAYMKVLAELEQVKRERDEAVDCCSGYCASCLFVKDCAKHDMNDAAPTRWYYGDCEDWEWRGQKED